MHSIRRISSGMSKCVPASSATAASASFCIQSRNASLPAILRLGSLSSRSAAAWMLGLPPFSRAATSRISPSIRASSSNPHA
jgi:hypothetical protein